ASPGRTRQWTTATATTSASGRAGTRRSSPVSVPELAQAVRRWRPPPPVIQAWRGRRTGPPLQAAGALVLLYASLSVLLRNHRPPLGVFVFGALIGLLYAMVAFGLILVYRANRIINFAQAEIGACAALLAVLLIKVHHMPYLLAFLVAMAAAVASGALIELLIVG